VVLRKAKKLAKISGLNSTNPALATSVDVGSEPTAVALSPTGATALVTNFGDGTVSFIDTATMSVTATLEVGPNPRAVAITNNNDASDADELAYVTLFFGQPIAEAVDDGRVGKVVEISLATKAKTATIDLAPLADTGFGVLQADAGFGASVGCSPNQLFNIAINQGRLYVSHVCASPKGPVSPTANLTAGVSVIDLATKLEDKSGPRGTLALSRLIREQDTAATSSLLGIPVELEFKKDTQVAYVLSQAGDAVQRVVWNGVRAPVVLGTEAAFSQIDLKGTGGVKAPIGIITANKSALAFTNNWIDRSISVINLATLTVDSVIDSDTRPMPGTPAARELNGKKFFFTGTGRWSLRGVSSCGSCHPDGLSDNITWVFGAGPRQTTPLDGTFSKTDPTDQRALNWTAIFDELHDFELNTRGTSGGKGAIVDGADARIALDVALSLDGGSAPTRNDNLSGSTKAVVAVRSNLKDWDDIEAYTKKIFANKAPSTIPAAAVTAGRAVFQSANCQYCHSGPKWTVSRVPYTPSIEKNGTAGATPTGLRTELRDGGSLPLPNAPNLNVDTLKVAAEALANPDGGANIVVGPERITCVVRNVGTFNAAEKKADGTLGQGTLGFNPPSLLSLASTAPYFHAGEAKTLEEVFQARFAQHHQAGNALFLSSGGTTAQEQTDLTNLIAFLKSIDDSTMPFPVPSNMDICGSY
jgi:YVTN family beta-propeller protein